MKVLITGGAGYLGTALIQLLSASQEVEQIVVYDNLSRGNYNLFIGQDKLSEKVAFKKADILDTRNLRKSLLGIDTVVHLAAKVTTPFADQSSHFFEQTNHWGTAELIYAMEESDVSRIIYLSSASVYGASSEEVDEHSATNPKTFYGISKLRGERHVNRLINAGRDASIIRCGNVFGYSKSMRFDSVINRFLFEANFLGKIAIHGSGKQHRSFVHIDRVSHVLSDIIHSEDGFTGTYNLVDVTYTIQDIVRALSTLYPKLETIFMDQTMKMRELKVKRDHRLEGVGPILVNDLESQLRTFKEALSF